MPWKRRSRAAQSWPESQLAWIERDRVAARWFQGAATRAWVVDFFDTVSRVGDGWVWFGIVACLPLAGGPAGASAAVRMVAVGLIDILIYRIVKRWIARPRPFRSCPEIRECGRSLDEYSFPSGHTLHSVACSVILTAYYPATAFVVWPLTLLIATSRIVLGLHYPSDVLVGALIGFVTATVSFNLL